MIAKDERLSSLAGVVRDEAERLNNDIQNLLDATRISRQQVKPRPEWIEPVDIVNSALERRRRRRLADHRIALDMDSNLPFIYVDPVQSRSRLCSDRRQCGKIFARGFHDQRVGKAQWPQAVVLTVNDNGAGLTEDEKGTARRAVLPWTAPRRRYLGLGPGAVDCEGLRGRQRRQVAADVPAPIKAPRFDSFCRSLPIPPN